MWHAALADQQDAASDEDLERRARRLGERRRAGSLAGTPYGMFERTVACHIVNRTHARLASQEVISGDPDIGSRRGGVIDYFFSGSSSLPDTASTENSNAKLFNLPRLDASGAGERGERDNFFERSVDVDDSQA